jgi:hypothetical protein
MIMFLTEFLTRNRITTWVPPQGEVPENPRAMAASPHAVRDEGGLLCPIFLLEPSALPILVAAKHRSY